MARHPRICKVPGCGEKHQALGYCQPHYMRQWRTGRVREDVPVGQGRKGARRLNRGGPGWPEDEL